MTSTVVLVEDVPEARLAVAGFLAGYCGSTRRSYATDVRLFMVQRGQAGTLQRAPSASRAARTVDK